MGKLGEEKLAAALSRVGGRGEIRPDGLLPLSFGRALDGTSSDLSRPFSTSSFYPWKL